MTPTARPAAARPAQAAYRQHVLYECQSLRDEQCQKCRDLARAASVEDGTRPGGWPPDPREIGGGR